MPWTSSCAESCFWIFSAWPRSRLGPTVTRYTLPEGPSTGIIRAGRLRFFSFSVSALALDSSANVPACTVQEALRCSAPGLGAAVLAAVFAGLAAVCGLTVDLGALVGAGGFLAVAGVVVLLAVAAGAGFVVAVADGRVAGLAGVLTGLALTGVVFLAGAAADLRADGADCLLVGVRAVASVAGGFFLAGFFTGLGWLAGWAAAALGR